MVLKILSSIYSPQEGWKPLSGWPRYLKSKTTLTQKRGYGGRFRMLLGFRALKSCAQTKMKEDELS